MRPLYESKLNRQAQLLVARRLCELKGSGWRFEISPPKLVWDAKLWSPAERRWYEIKIRHRDWNGDHPPIVRDGYMISQRKVDGLRRTAAGDPWGVVADCPDGLYAMTRRRPDVPEGTVLRMSGRKDRGDRFDWEPCYYIPARFFIRVCDTVNHAGSGSLFDEPS